MASTNKFEVIIIGGSYAGLAAALTLGRSQRNVLIIDSGKPCNAQTPLSHNFLTQDGKSPMEISSLAKEQVMAYPTVTFQEGHVIDAYKITNGFEVALEDKQTFSGKKIIFATGIRDVFPSIDGFAKCWGITAIHCPYCHGYELRNQPTAILANRDMAMHFAKLAYNLSKDITILTNGAHEFSGVDLKKLAKNNIQLIETGIAKINHTAGKISSIQFNDGKSIEVSVLYAGLPIQQHSQLPELIGCRLDDNGLILVDESQQTTVEGVFACGDNANMRSLAVAVKAGMVAGAYINMLFCEEEF
jgi:thioredoxin reductase